MSAHTDTVRDVALTITTDQIKGWGLVGGAIIVVAAMLIVKFATSAIGRTAWICIALVTLFLCYQQHAAIEKSIRQCDPHVLFIHLEISDPHDKAKCLETVNQATHPTKDTHKG